VKEVIAREFSVVLARQSVHEKLEDFVRQNQPEQKLTTYLNHLDALKPSDAQKKLRAIIGLCQIAAFIEPAVYSKTFTESKGTV